MRKEVAPRMFSTSITTMVEVLVSELLSDGDISGDVVTDCDTGNVGILGIFRPEVLLRPNKTVGGISFALFGWLCTRL